MNEELSRKLAKWAGLCWHEWKFSDDIDFNSFRLPNGKQMSNNGYLNRCLECGASSDNKFKDIEDYNFTQSLDACFKWLVPKLDDIGEYYIVFQRAVWNKPLPKSVTISFVSGKVRDYEEQEETYALALCLAIEKLIDKKMLNETNKV